MKKCSTRLARRGGEGGGEVPEAEGVAVWRAGTGRQACWMAKRASIWGCWGAMERGVRGERWLGLGVEGGEEGKGTALPFGVWMR